MNWKIPLFKINWDEADLKAVDSVISRGSFWAEGPEIACFEDSLKRYCGRNHAVAFNSGTSALHAALLALDVKGKEVIVPSFTFISSVNAVLLAGGKPVFADVETDTCALDAVDVEKRITRKTSAILPTHYAGFAARDIERLAEIAEEKGIALVEDAAESLGARISGKMAGCFGKAGMYSFCQNKVVAAGEGGAIVTDDKELSGKLRLLRSHGRSNEDYFSSTEPEDYVGIGYNYRMPSALAALAKSQLAKAEKMIEMRARAAAYYTKALSEIEKIETLKELPASRPVYQMFPVFVEEKSRDSLQQHLAKQGIMSKVYFWPVHLKAVYRRRLGTGKGMLPITERLSKRALSLPFWPGIKEKEIDFVVDSIKSFFRES